MPHGIPTTGELAEAVREFLEREVMAAVEGRRGFLTRVTINVMGQIERELALGPTHARVHAERLAKLGLRDDAELCRAIRDGSLDGRRSEVVGVVRAGVVDRLQVSNPRYLQPQDRSTQTDETDRR
jgi:Domain of unknown function (DUF6285)